MPGKHGYYKKMAEGGRSDMSAKPDIKKPEPEKAMAPPTPMMDAIELSNVNPMTGKRYPDTKQMKYGGAVIYSNGPRKVRT
tara:strand:- start:41958 stop:42200 length:243 start_codon:yes stop_codon:yes gene_type:complete